MSLRFNSFNARGLRDSKKRRVIFHWLKSTYKGICLLQETHCTVDQEEKWRREWGGHIEFCHGSSRSKGVAVLFPPRLDVKVDKKKEGNGHLVVLDVSLKEQHYLLMNVYAPTKDKEQEQISLLEKIAEILEENQDKSVIIGGDLNTYLNPDLDKQGGSTTAISNYAVLLNSLMEEYSLIDIYRAINPDRKRYSWRGMTRNGLVQSRLDYFLILSHMVYDVSNVSIEPSIKSDHSIISAEFNFDNTCTKGRGFWKFNSSLLVDKEYVTLIKETIKQSEDKYLHLDDKGLMWDLIKCEIRSKTISYSAWRSKNIKKRADELKNELEQLEYNHGTLANNIDVYKLKKGQLEDLLQQQAHGVQIRSRASFIEKQ